MGISTNDFSRFWSEYQVTWIAKHVNSRSRKSYFVSKMSGNDAKRCALMRWSFFLLNDNQVLILRRPWWGQNSSPQNAEHHIEMLANSSTNMKENCRRRASPLHFLDTSHLRQSSLKERNPQGSATQAQKRLENKCQYHRNITKMASRISQNSAKE